MADAVRVQGAAQLRRALKKAGADLGDLTAAHKQAATLVATAARAFAPHRTGALAGTVRAGATRKTGVVRAGFKAVPYAGPVHWGWPSRPNKARRWRGGPIRPNPFMARAMDATQAQWVPVYETAIDKILTKNFPYYTS